MFQQIGPMEIAIIVVVLLLVFGASRVGDVGGALGRSIREFRRELREGEEQKEGLGRPEPTSDANVESRSGAEKDTAAPGSSSMTH